MSLVRPRIAAAHRNVMQAGPPETWPSVEQALNEQLITLGLGALVNAYGPSKRKDKKRLLQRLKKAELRKQRDEDVLHKTVALLQQCLQGLEDPEESLGLDIEGTMDPRAASEEDELSDDRGDIAGYTDYDAAARQRQSYGQADWQQAPEVPHMHHYGYHDQVRSPSLEGLDSLEEDPEPLPPISHRGSGGRGSGGSGRPARQSYAGVTPPRSPRNRREERRHDGVRAVRREVPPLRERSISDHADRRARPPQQPQPQHLRQPQLPGGMPPLPVHMGGLVRMYSDETMQQSKASARSHRDPVPALDGGHLSSVSWMLHDYPQHVQPANLANPFESCRPNVMHSPRGTRRLQPTLLPAGVSPPAPQYGEPLPPGPGQPRAPGVLGVGAGWRTGERMSSQPRQPIHTVYLEAAPQRLLLFACLYRGNIRHIPP